MARRGPTPLPEYTPHPVTTPPDAPDLIAQLRFEHRQLQRLWAELQLVHRRHVGDRPAARHGSAGQQALARQILQALAEHEALERDALYPRTAAVMGDALVAHAEAEHADARSLLAEVDGEDLDDDLVFEVFTKAFTKVMAHIEEEERIIFPMLQALLPEADLARPDGSEQSPAPDVDDVVDIAAAERHIAAGGGRKERIRSRLLRR